MALCDTIKHHNKNEKPCVLGFWHFLTSERIAGLSASLSAINLENQGITKSVHDLVHESPIFGAFLLSFPNKGWNKEARTNRASNIVPQRELWLSQQCGCKDTAFFRKSALIQQESF